MTSPTDAWDSLDICLDWETGECPTIERSVPLELIRLTEREQWADSCPTLQFQVPTDLVARSVPPPPGEPVDDTELRCLALQSSTANSPAEARTSVNPAVAGVLAFIAAALVTIALASIIQFALASGVL